MDIVLLAVIIAPLILTLLSLCGQVAAQARRIDLLDQQLARFVIDAAMHQHRNRPGGGPPMAPGGQATSAGIHHEPLHPDPPLPAR